MRHAAGASLTTATDTSRATGCVCRYMHAQNHHHDVKSSQPNGAPLIIRRWINEGVSLCCDFHLKETIWRLSWGEGRRERGRKEVERKRGERRWGGGKRNRSSYTTGSNNNYTSSQPEYQSTKPWSRPIIKGAPHGNSHGNRVMSWLG